MKNASHLLSVASLGVIALALATGRAAEPIEKKPAPATTTNATVATIELRGRVVCLPEEMHRRHQSDLPTHHEHVWGFASTNSVCFTLLRGRFAEAIWLDERVRARELQIRARLFPKTQILEIVNLKSVRDGVVQDLYYFCNVCIIQSVSPEICACCQAPVVLVEKPLKAGNE